MFMVVVLWLSRHPPLKVQLETLKAKLGNVELKIYNKPLGTVEEATKLVEQYKAKYVVPVLPLSFIARLVEESKKKDFVVLWAEMELLHNCKEGVKCKDYDPNQDSIVKTKDMQTGEEFFRHYRFRGFKILKAIKFETEEF